MENTIKNNEIIIASVAIMGAIRGTGWRYARYEADAKLRSGYRFKGYETHGMYPNAANHKWSLDFEKRIKEQGGVICYGRPVQKINAPQVID